MSDHKFAECRRCGALVETLETGVVKRYRCDCGEFEFVCESCGSPHIDTATTLCPHCQEDRLWP